MKQKQEWFVRIEIKIALGKNGDYVPYMPSNSLSPSPALPLPPYLPLYKTIF